MSEAKTPRTPMTDKRETPQTTAFSLLMDACERNGSYFNKRDVLAVAEAIKLGHLELREDNHDGENLFPTDLGWLRFHEAKVAEFQAKLRAPEAAPSQSPGEK